MSDFSDLALAHPFLRSYFKLGESSGTFVDSGPAGIIPTEAGTIIRNQSPMVRGEPRSPMWIANSYLDLGDVYEFIGVIPCSISFWIRLGFLFPGPNAAGVICKNDPNNSPVTGWVAGIWTMDQSNNFQEGPIYYQRHDGAGNNAYIDTLAAGKQPNSSLYFATCGHDGTNQFIHQNGVTYSQVSSLLVADDPNPLRIGTFSNGFSGITGNLGHILIHNTALTLAEHTALYQAGRIENYI